MICASSATSRRPALFLHTQKTAGTSIQVMARYAYGNDAVISHADYQRLGVTGCQPYPFISGHFGYEFARPLMSDRYCFTFLRDPVERLISLYSFCADQAGDDNPLYVAARWTDLLGFLRLSSREPFRHHLWNHQVWQLAYGRDAAAAGAPERWPDDFRGARLLAMAKANIETFDYVGLVETFDEDALAIFEAIGWNTPKLQRYNTSTRRSSVSSLPLRARWELLRLTRWDRKLYSHVFQKRYGVVADRRRRRRALRDLFQVPPSRRMEVAHVDSP